jgi:hypothetical protein
MGMYEQSPEGRAARQREQDAELKVKTIVALMALFFVVSTLSCWGHVMYGDWGCGFIECRVVVGR